MCGEPGWVESCHVHYVPSAVVRDVFLPAQLSRLHVVGQDEGVGRGRGRGGGCVRVSRGGYLCVHGRGRRAEFRIRVQV